MSILQQTQYGCNTSLDSVSRTRNQQPTRASPITLSELRRHLQSVQSVNGSFRGASSRSLGPQSRHDLRIYPGGNVNDLFGSSVPQHGSQACLINDHYMLVKMPDACWRRNSLIESIVEEPEPEETQPPRNARKETNTAKKAASSAVGVGEKFIRCFRCKRTSRRILPVHESHRTSTVGSNLAKATAKCLIGEQEIFYTRTKLTRTTPRAHLAKVEVQAVPKAQDSPLDLTVPRQRLPGDVTAGSEADVFGSRTLKLDTLPLATSLHDRVVLEQHGFLRTLKTDSLEERKASAVGRAAPKSTLKKPPNLQRGFNPLRWLLGPIGDRSRLKPMQKSKAKSKPKSKSKSKAKPEAKARQKIHAVVYKTYFVRWMRPEEPMHHMPPLKRARSAFF